MNGDIERCSLVGKLDVKDPATDDFELWSPSEERNERCLFGRQVGLFLAFTQLDINTTHLL